MSILLSTPWIPGSHRFRSQAFERNKCVFAKIFNKRIDDEPDATVFASPCIGLAEYEHAKGDGGNMNADADDDY